MDTTQISKIMKALSHPKRLELFLNISKQNNMDIGTGCDCFVYHMMDMLRLGAPTISHHMKELENAGLITTERKGKFLSASINMEVLKVVSQFFKIE